MDLIVGTLLVILLTIIINKVYQAWKINRYWADRDIPHVKPVLFFGNSAPLLLKKKPMAELHEDICKQFPNEPIIGFYNFMKPSLLIKDADIVERILIKDFQYFTDRGFPVNEARNPLDSNLFTMKGKRWKAVRNKLSPIFTTGKLKLMFDIINEQGDVLVKILENYEEVEIKDILGRFAMDVIGSWAFGFNAKNLTNPGNKFERMSKKIFKMDIKLIIKLILISSFPLLSKFINITLKSADVRKYFSDLIKNTVKERRESDYKRNDFVQLMLQLQDRGYIEVQADDPDDQYLNINDSSQPSEKFELTLDILTGQALSFLTAGIETLTSAMLYTLYELAKHQDIQEQVRDEVRREFNKSSSLNYDSIKEMVFLEQCIKESMRMHTPGEVIFRSCTKPYVFQNGLSIEPGESVVIPVKAIHNDPNYYPEPEKFKPERFDINNNIPSCAFLPFGNGPRICIAMRFAMVEIKFCLAKLLLNFNFKLSPKTKEPLTVSIKSIVNTPNEKVIFNLIKLKEV